MRIANRPGRAPSAGLSGSRRLAGFGVALGGVAVVSLGLLPVRGQLGLETVLLLQLLVCVVASVIGGVWPAALAAVTGFVSANYLYAEPYGSLFVRREGQLWNLLAFLAVAVAVVAVVEAGARQRAAAAELDRIDQLRASLLAAVGHDLRTPLAAVKASVSTLRQPDIRLAEADRQELLEAIEDNADRLGELIANLLDMSRLQAGALSVRLVPVAVEEVLAGALRASGDRVQLDLAADLPLVLADPGLLERVLENLVANAARHVGAGEPVVIRGRHSDGRVRVSVIDHGPGVPEERFDAIFQPFQHFDDRSDGGVGLGLAIARGFLAAQDATVTPSTTPGGGLTMTVDLAVAP